MQTDKFEISIGNLGVKTTSNRGHTAEEVAEMATDKIISISNNADPMIKAQAHAFKDRTKNWGQSIEFVEEAKNRGFTF